MILRNIIVKLRSGFRFYTTKNTIFGLSSGQGKCGVAVLRLSGPDAGAILNKMILKNNLPTPRMAVLSKIFHPSSKEVIDKGLILWFPGPNSFTGEDCCEFHVHGGPAIISMMYDSFSNFKNVRLAEAGEFTKRAFYAGKLDLTEIEGLADLIDAETEAQRKQAVLQANGELSNLYKGFRGKILKCIANTEAYIDFAEDQHIDDSIMSQVDSELQIVEQEIKKHLNDNRRGERLRNGVRTIVLGAPNVGKSSFVNLICQKNISIVTPIEGTTRDIIESHYDIGGYPIILADTAGLRNFTEDIVETEGILRARNYIESSDLVIILLDSREVSEFLEKSKGNFTDYCKKYYLQLGLDIENLQESGKKMVLVLNKVDLLNKKSKETLKTVKNIIKMSCLQKQGVETALEGIQVNLEKLCGNPTRENLNLSQERHRFHLKQCLDYIKNYREYTTSAINVDLAIATQQLRNAVRSIGKITGDVATDEILDYIFKNFCIGK